MFRTLALALLACALTTCAGVWTDYSVVTHDGGVHHLTKNLISENIKNTTKQEVLNKLGEPQEKIIIDEKIERWVYPYEKAWKGIYLIFIVPIPIKAPFGNLHVFVDFENEMVKNTSYESLSGSIYACGIGFLAMTAMTNGYKPTLCGKMD